MLGCPLVAVPLVPGQLGSACPGATASCCYLPNGCGSVTGKRPLVPGQLAGGLLVPGQLLSGLLAAGLLGSGRRGRAGYDASGGAAGSVAVGYELAVAALLAAAPAVFQALHHGRSGRASLPGSLAAAGASRAPAP